MILFACQQCAMKFQVKEEFAGRSTKCPTCKQPIVVPPPADETQAYVPKDALNGTNSSLDQAGFKGGVTLAVAGKESDAGNPSVGNILAQSGAKTGRYVLEKEIARGGMGAVLRAVDRDLRREVAVKYMINSDNAHHKARFIEEAQITGQLEHPHIVPIHELGVDGQKRLFFSMKMVQGRSLAQIHKELRDKPAAAKDWPLHRLVNILINVCNAIAYAHSRSVIHRDLKPANIMVGEFGEVYVMDWGLAKVLRPGPIPLAEPVIIATANPKAAAVPVARFATGDSQGPSSAGSKISTSRDADEDLTHDGAVMGTPVYMPPEQALGHINEIDQRSDVYALGAILYEMLTLQPPVDKQGGQAMVLKRVIEGEIQPPALRSPARAQHGDIPPELAALAMKALAKAPKDRYPTAEAFRGDLERFQEGKSVSAKHDTPREAFVKFVKRNKGFSAATGTALVLLTVVLAVAFWFINGARVDARTQQAKAESAFTAFEKEQKEKEKSIQRSLPAFMAVARQQAAEGKIDDARSNVEMILTYDTKHAAARLLKAQIHLATQQWPAAQSDLETYLRQEPKDASAQQLAQLCKKDKDATTLHEMVLLLQEQKLNGLATPLLQEVQKTVQDRKPLFELHRKQIQHFYPGAKFTLEANGQVKLIRAESTKSNSDLNPLQGMPINNLIWGRTAITNLSPLKGMPLVSLDLHESKLLQDLEPLRGMKLTNLVLNHCPQVRDLTPLKGMRLTQLGLSETAIRDLSPLQGMPLTSLILGSCPQLRDLGPLQGLPLRVLTLRLSREIRDFTPLRGMPLTSLDLLQTQVEDLDPLKGMPLTTLNLSGTKISSLTPLEGMPLTSLDLHGTRIHDLSPLKGAPLVYLGLSGTPVSDLEPLRGMPLTSLNIDADKIRDVSPLQGMPLKQIKLIPKNIDKGMEVLRALKSLETITANGLNYAADDFWRRYDKGEFKK